MSNPNIVYLANDLPKPSTSTTTAEPIATITSNNKSNETQRFSSEIQIPPPVIPAYSNQQANLSQQVNLIAGCQNHFIGINRPAVESNPGYYGLAPNVIDVSSLNYTSLSSDYIASGYCEFDYSNAWVYLTGKEVLNTPSVQLINEMALDPYSAPNHPTQSCMHPMLDSSETSKKYNQEVDKFLNRIKLNNDVASKTTKVKNNLACDCSKYKKHKTSVKHVLMKKTKNIKNNTKVSSGKTKKIDEIKKQIDLIENEIQRRKTELSVKEQQIQDEINMIQQKQPMVLANSTNQVVTRPHNEEKILDGETFENENATIALKKKPLVKSVVNIANNLNLNNSNKYKIDHRERRKSDSKNYNYHPYINPLKIKNLAKSNNLKSYVSNNNNLNNNVNNNPQINSERLEKKTKENIVISLNLEQDLHCSNKQFTISQHETTDKNEKEIHLTIKITENEKPPLIKNTKNEENDGSVIDLSFLDEIDVDEIVECLNISDEPMETNVTATELQNPLNEINTDSLKADSPSDFKIGSTKKLQEPDSNNTNVSSILSELKLEKTQELTKDVNHKCTEVIKQDQVYDEYMEICNIINDPGFMTGSQNASQPNENSFSGNPSPMSDCYDPIKIKTCNIETETFNPEYNNDEMKIQENCRHADYVNQGLKDDISESAASLTSYSNSTEYEYSINNDNTLEPSDSLREDIESDNIEQRAKKLLLSIFNNPEILHTQAMSQNNPKYHIPSLEQIVNRENALDIDEEMAVCSEDSNIDNSSDNINYHATETIIFECNNNNEGLSKGNKGTHTITNVDTLKVGVTSDNKLVKSADDTLKTNFKNNITETQQVENLINVKTDLITQEAIGDQNTNPFKIKNDNDINSRNSHTDGQEINQTTAEIVYQNRTYSSIQPKVKKEFEKIAVALEESIGTSSLSKNHENAKEDTQIEYPNNNISKIEISEEQLVNMKQNDKNKTNFVVENDNDVVIITPEPNIAILDLTEGSERKKTRKKITYNESCETVPDKNIIKKSESNCDENLILPHIEQLKSPRDFALALKLEQSISKYFNSEHEITGIIKRGMYSDIYRGRNKNTGQVATAKVIRNRKEMKQLGIEKTEWMKELQEGIPKDKYHCTYLFHGLIVDGMWCFVLEYYPKNLEQVLMERGRGFSIEIVQKLARQLVSAVLLLRNYNIIHSDIKPKHILVDATNENLKLCGFDESFQRVNGKGMSCIGTVHYRAPELILGYFVGHGIDVWATALVLYEMTTNIKLFPANTDNEVLYQQLCTAGPVSIRMLTNSRYKEFHYKGGHFFRNGMDPAYKRKPRIIYRFFESERINVSVYGAYTKHWARIRSEHKDADQTTLNQFCKLLKQMLTMDPHCRIGIESVYAHSFIYE